MRSDQYFIYTDGGNRVGEPAANLNELVQSVGRADKKVILGHMQRHDFSRWILSVFDDPGLVGQIRELETRLLVGKDMSVFSDSLAAVVSARYNATDNIVDSTIN